MIVDSRLETPHGARILQRSTLVFAGTPGTLLNAEVVASGENSKVDLPRALEELARRGVNELHVEAGFRLNGSLVREGCVDEYLIYLNPSSAPRPRECSSSRPPGSRSAGSACYRWTGIGEDLRVLARPA